MVHLISYFSLRYRLTFFVPGDKSSVTIGLNCNKFYQALVTTITVSHYH